MALSVNISTLVPEAEALEAQVATLVEEKATLEDEKAAAESALTELMTLTQAYLSAPEGESSSQAAALIAFLSAHTGQG